MKISYSRHSFQKLVLKLTTDESLITHYPSLSKLAKIILIYLASTSEIERGFSCQNATRIKFCNQLSAHDAYRRWTDAKHHRYIILLPQKNTDIDDSDSSSGSDSEE